MVYILLASGLVVVICLLISLVLARIILSFLDRDREDRQIENEIHNGEFRNYISDFSVSKYMDRIEKAGIEIMTEADKRPEYQLVLLSVC